MLIHMTDSSQNSKFQDNYFPGIDKDEEEKQLVNKQVITNWGVLFDGEYICRSCGEVLDIEAVIRLPDFSRRTSSTS